MPDGRIIGSIPEKICPVGSGAVATPGGAVLMMNQCMQESCVFYVASEKQCLFWCLYNEARKNKEVSK